MGWLFGNDSDDSSVSENATYGGENAEVQESGDRTDIFYGGTDGNPVGPGHGHIVSNDGGESVDYHRGSAAEGGGVFFDNK